MDIILIVLLLLATAYFSFRYFFAAITPEHDAISQYNLLSVLSSSVVSICVVSLMLFIEGLRYVQYFSTGNKNWMTVPIGIFLSIPLLIIFVLFVKRIVETGIVSKTFNKTDRELQEVVNSLKNIIGVKYMPEVRLNDKILVPEILGWRANKSIVLLPTNFRSQIISICDNNTEKASVLIKYILAHELSHLRNKDYIYLPYAMFLKKYWYIWCIAPIVSSVILYIEINIIPESTIIPALALLIACLHLRICLPYIMKKREHIADARASLSISDKELILITSNDGIAYIMRAFELYRNRPYNEKYSNAWVDKPRYDKIRRIIYNMFYGTILEKPVSFLDRALFIYHPDNISRIEAIRNDSYIKTNNIFIGLYESVLLGFTFGLLSPIILIAIATSHPIWNVISDGSFDNASFFVRLNFTIWHHVFFAYYICFAFAFAFICTLPWRTTMSVSALPKYRIIHKFTSRFIIMVLSSLLTFVPIFMLSSFKLTLSYGFALCWICSYAYSILLMATPDKDNLLLIQHNVLKSIRFWVSLLLLATLFCSTVLFIPYVMSVYCRTYINTLLIDNLLFYWPLPIFLCAFIVFNNIIIYEDHSNNLIFALELRRRQYKIKKSFGLLTGVGLILFITLLLSLPVYIVIILFLNNIFAFVDPLRHEYYPLVDDILSNYTPLLFIILGLMIGLAVPKAINTYSTSGLSQLMYGLYIIKHYCDNKCGWNNNAEVFRQLKSNDGGYTHSIKNKYSSIYATYFVTKSIKLLDSKYEDKEAIKYILSCENNEGGFGVLPEVESSTTATYYALNLIAEFGALRCIDRGKHIAWAVNKLNNMLADKNKINMDQAMLVLEILILLGDANIPEKESIAIKLVQEWSRSNKNIKITYYATRCLLIMGMFHKTIGGEIKNEWLPKNEHLAHNINLNKRVETLWMFIQIAREVDDDKTIKAVVSRLEPRIIELTEELFKKLNGSKHGNHTA
jgi:hypothetical protein